MKLPNGERAVIDLQKLREYCLNAQHPRGQQKARVFERALGWTAVDAEAMQRRLQEAARSEDAVFLGADDYGQRYARHFEAQGKGTGVAVRSLWIVRHGEDFSRFASCYVL